MKRILLASALLAASISNAQMQDRQEMICRNPGLKIFLFKPLKSAEGLGKSFKWKGTLKILTSYMSP